MKILFVVKTIDYIDPIGIMLLSALVKTNGHTTHLGILDRENILNKIDDLKPDIIAYSASTGEHKYYLEINKIIKSRFKNVFTVMGGPHTTFYPECIKDNTLDAICIGEGEEAFIELLSELEKGRNISKIRNIVTRSGPNNGIRELYVDLDNLPFPDRELFYENTEMGRFPLKSFMASRGCPYPCTYCFNHAFRDMYRGKGRVIRRHSIDYMIEEIRRVKDRYVLGFVKFSDDIFVYRADEWLEEFVRKYRKEIGIPFCCLTRTDLLTDEIAKLLKQAGCHSISMSIEAGNPYFRNNVLRRNMSEEQITRAFHFCHKYDIKTFSNNILGLPFSTTENEIETLDLNVRCRVSFAEFPIFHPYPRTELGNFCIEKGIYTPKYEDLHMSYMNKSPLSCFTEQQKNIQRNLSRLGALVLLFPFLRNIVVNHLIYLPYNKLFFLCYYLTKIYLNKTRVYPSRIGIRDLVRLFLKSTKLENFKLSDERFKTTSEIK